MLEARGTRKNERRIREWGELRGGGGDRGKEEFWAEGR